MVGGEEVARGSTVKRKELCRHRSFLHQERKFFCRHSPTKAFLPSIDKNKSLPCYNYNLYS